MIGLIDRENVTQSTQKIINIQLVMDRLSGHSLEVKKKKKSGRKITTQTGHPLEVKKKKISGQKIVNMLSLTKADVISVGQKRTNGYTNLPPFCDGLGVVKEGERHRQRAAQRW